MKVRHLPQFYGRTVRVGGGTGCKGLIYDWLTALFIAAAAAPTEVKEILYTQPHKNKLTKIIMARSYNIWI
jgi:hypothetical protein